MVVSFPDHFSPYVHGLGTRPNFFFSAWAKGTKVPIRLAVSVDDVVVNTPERRDPKLGDGN